MDFHCENLSRLKQLFFPFSSDFLQWLVCVTPEKVINSARYILQTLPFGHIRTYTFLPVLNFGDGR